MVGAILPQVSLPQALFTRLKAAGAAVEASWSGSRNSVVHVASFEGCVTEGPTGLLTRPGAWRLSNVTGFLDGAGCYGGGEVVASDRELQGAFERQVPEIFLAETTRCCAMACPSPCPSPSISLLLLPSSSPKDRCED